MAIYVEKHLLLISATIKIISILKSRGSAILIWSCAKAMLPINFFFN